VRIRFQNYLFKADKRINHLEDIFELGTTAENYGEYYGTTGKSMADSTAGRDPHDQLGGRPGQIRNPPALINTIMQLNPAHTHI